MSTTLHERLYTAPGLEQYRPEAVLAQSLAGLAVPALCYNLREAHGLMSVILSMRRVFSAPSASSISRKSTWRRSRERQLRARER